MSDDKYINPNGTSQFDSLSQGKPLDSLLLQSKDSEASRFIRGFNRKENLVITQSKTDAQGFVFFTKPFCNLLEDNLLGREARRLLWLADRNPDSMAAAIKCSLMPDPNMFNVVSRAQGVGRSGGRIAHTRSSIVDDFNPFIPMLTSSITNLTGWPDRVTEYFQSEEGIAKEVHAYVDNRPDQFGTFDLTASFAASDGDFINGWCQSLWEYQSHVAQGTLLPFPAFITERELDYNVRIYRVILDPTGMYVRKMACVGAAILGADTSGADFNYTSESLTTQDNNEISVPFKCMGAWYNDPACVRAFNNTTFMYNPGLKDPQQRNANFTKLTPDEVKNHTVGYPVIADDMELQWWVPNAVYELLFNFDLGI